MKTRSSHHIAEEDVPHPGLCVKLTLGVVVKRRLDYELGYREWEVYGEQAASPVIVPIPDNWPWRAADEWVYALMDHEVDLVDIVQKQSPETWKKVEEWRYELTPRYDVKEEFEVVEILGWCHADGTPYDIRPLEAGRVRDILGEAEDEWDRCLQDARKLYVEIKKLWHESGYYHNKLGEKVLSDVEFHYGQDVANWLRYFMGVHPRQVGWTLQRWSPEIIADHMDPVNGQEHPEALATLRTPEFRHFLSRAIARANVRSMLGGGTLESLDDFRPHPDLHVVVKLRIYGPPWAHDEATAPDNRGYNLEEWDDAIVTVPVPEHCSFDEIENWVFQRDTSEGSIMWWHEFKAQSPEEAQRIETEKGLHLGVAVVGVIGYQHGDGRPYDIRPFLRDRVGRLLNTDEDVMSNARKVIDEFTSASGVPGRDMGPAPLVAPPPVRPRPTTPTRPAQPTKPGVRPWHPTPRPGVNPRPKARFRRTGV